MTGTLLDLPETTVGATPDFLTTALRTSRAIGDGVRVTAADHEQIAVGVSISGQLARLHLTYDPPAAGPATLIFKLPPTAAENRAIGTGFLMYEREGLFYGEFADQVPMRKPRCYWSRVDAQAHLSGLLLEDLGGWAPCNQVAGATPAQALAAVTAAADMHGAFWGSPALDAPWLPRLDSPLYLTLAQLYRAGWPSFAERFGGLLSSAALDLGRRTGEAYEDLLRTCTAEAPLTLTHGDFRADNMFFQSTDDRADHAEVAIVDWQLVVRGPAVQDLAMFLTQSLEVEVRRRHERDLVRAWHDRLAAVAGPAASGYPLDVAWDHYRRMSLFTLLIPVVVGGSMDVGNERGHALAVGMATRSFTAATDLGAGEFLA